MRRRRARSLLVKVLPVLLPVAIIGYLLGGSVPGSSSPGTSTAPIERTLAQANTVVLEYPTYYGWSPLESAPRIPGLALEHAFALVPGGQGAQGTRLGLVAGQLPEGAVTGASPIPAKLLENQPQLSGRAEVVSLLDTQAYRYSQSGQGTGNTRLVVYAIPDTATTNTVIVCFAPSSPAYLADLRTCERIAAQLTLQGGAQSQTLLTPEAGYSQEVHKLLDRLQHVRADTRSTLHAQANLASFASVASELSQGFATARSSLMTLQPPTPAGTAHTGLAGALSQASAAYSQLAKAAAERSTGGFSLARQRVYDAESGVAQALRAFALIGYG